MSTSPRTHALLTKLFPLAVAVAGVFVWVSGQSLPSMMASHFGASGQADGFMPREAYRLLMTGVTVGVPLLVVYVPNWLIRAMPGAVNLPHRNDWLAPERQAATLDALRRMSFGFGWLLLGFLAYVQWLVLRANTADPPALPLTWLVGGLLLFVCGNLFLIFLLFRRFGRVPGAPRTDGR